jgi:hypothetical protein
VSNEHRYPLSWHMRSEDPPLSRGQLQAAGRGGCDAMVIHSMGYPEDGGFSMKTLSLDGRTGQPVDDEELFKVWALLAHQLMTSPTLSPGKRELCEAAHGYIHRIVMMGRDGGESS